MHIESHARVKVSEEPLDGFACDLLGRLTSATQCADPAKTVSEFGAEEQGYARTLGLPACSFHMRIYPAFGEQHLCRAPILSTMCWGKLAAIDRPQMRLIGPRSVIASGRKVNNDRRPVVHAEHLERQIEQAPHALAGRLGVVD